MAPALGDFLKSINSKKKNLMDADPLAEKEYVPFVVDRSLSYFIDTVLYANEMNLRHEADSKMQYDYLINSIRKGNRFSRWIKKVSVPNLDLVKEYYGCNTARAEEALTILSEADLDNIRRSLEKGGRSK